MNALPPPQLTPIEPNTRGRKRWPWLLGALGAGVCVASLAVALTVVANADRGASAANADPAPLATDATPVTTTPATTTPAPVDVPTTTAAPVPTAAPPSTNPQRADPPVDDFPSVARVTASVVRPDSIDSCGSPTTYPASQIFDGELDTAWMAPGDGSGQTVTFELNGPSRLREVGLMPGYDKFDPCTGTDRFHDLRRVTSVRWTFDDGRYVDQYLSATPEYQTMTLNDDVVTSTVRLTIASTMPSGDPRLDHTPISEVIIR